MSEQVFANTISQVHVRVVANAEHAVPSAMRRELLLSLPKCPTDTLALRLKNAQRMVATSQQCSLVKSPAKSLRHQIT